MVLMQIFVLYLQMCPVGSWVAQLVFWGLRWPEQLAAPAAPALRPNQTVFLSGKEQHL